MKIKLLKRFCRIAYVVAKYRLDSLITAIPLFKAFRILTYLNPKSYFQTTLPTGDALCLALEELGPIFVKFGQALSTRKDLLPKDITKALSRLQDDVKPFDSDIAVDLINTAYGKTVEDVFLDFDQEPFASASIAQVHKATLKNKQPVIVKIVRPSIHKTIRKDIDLMYALANILERYWAQSHRVKPREIVKEFEQTIFDELDMMREAANASLLKRHYHESPELYIPKVYWDYTRKNILVTEKISGIPISDIDELKAQGINLKQLAETGINIFFTQVFENGFFHADMHPGNIFANPHKESPPQYMAVDFGIMGTLTDTDKRYLAQNLLAFFNRNYRQIALLHIESGWVPKDTRIDAFESAIRTVSEPIFEKPLKEMSFAQIVIHLFQTARAFEMEVQPQLILLQKTLLAVEGLGRELYPELNLWHTAKPFLEKWVKAELGPMTFIQNFKEHLPYVINQLPTLPRQVIEALDSHKKMQQSLETLTALQKQRKKPYLYALGLSLVAAPAVAMLLTRLADGNLASTISFSSLGLGAMILIYSYKSQKET